VAEEIVSLKSDSGAVLPYLLSTDDAQPATQVAVLFTGGPGRVGLLGKGIPQPGANFLVRSRRHFLKEGVATAVVDAPSDLRGMNDRFRMSPAHARDVGTVVADLRRRLPGLPVYLVGTSRGTVSAAYAAAALGKAVDGVVLTSSVFNAGPGGAGLSGFDYKALQAPLLLVHHADDACPVTPHHEAARLALHHRLVTVHGGLPAQSEACEAFAAHGYLGVEAEAVTAIVGWMQGRQPPTDVP
jgi:pimeloyl-ACP methyl ester carboxylesterase